MSIIKYTNSYKYYYRNESTSTLAIKLDVLTNQNLSEVETYCNSGISFNSRVIRGAGISNTVLIASPMHLYLTKAARSGCILDGRAILVSVPGL